MDATRRGFLVGTLLTGLSSLDSFGATRFSFCRRGILNHWIDPSTTAVELADFTEWVTEKGLRELVTLDEDQLEKNIKKMLFKRYEDSQSDRNLRLGIMVGHNKEAQGANGVGDLKGVSEYRFNCEMAEILQGAISKLKGIEAKVFYREPHPEGYSAEIAQAYNKMQKEFKPDCTTELHFNCSSKKAARYTCVLSKKDKKSSLLAGACMHGMCASLTGDQQSTKRYPGGNFLAGLFSSDKKATKILSVPSVILEPTFAGSNADDASLLKVKREQMARSLAAAIRDLKPALLA